MSASSKPIPIALPNELLGEIDQVAEKLNLTRSELMRLSMRIGLAEIGAVAESLTKTVARETERLGITFADWVRETQQQTATKDRHVTINPNEEPTPESPTPCALLEKNVTSPSTTHAKEPHTTEIAKIVKLPAPPVLTTIIHTSMGQTSPALPQRKTKQNKPRLQHKTGTED